MEFDLVVREETPESWRGANDLVTVLNRDFELLAEAEHLTGVPEWIAPVEVIGVYVGTTIARRGLDTVVDRVVEAAISWAQSALRSERRSWRGLLTFGLRVRPKRVVIYGPSGDVLRSVLVRRPNSDPEISA